MRTTQHIDYQAIRPNDVIFRIFEATKKFGKPFKLRARQRLRTSPSAKEQNVWFFSTGMFSVYREMDELQVLSSYASHASMSVYGLVEALQNEKVFFLLTETDCEGVCVPIEAFMKQRDNSTLWFDVAMLMSYFIKVAYKRDQNLTGVSSYEMIKYQLLTLMTYPDDIRRKINVQSFISERTKISRSNIFRILNELQKGGFIDIERGRVISVGVLPEKF